MNPTTTTTTTCPPVAPIFNEADHARHSAARMQARRAITTQDAPPPVQPSRAAAVQHFHLSLKSGNAKTGPIPVSTTTATSCPASCPFNRGGGCYAGSGPLALHWQKITRGERGGPFPEFLEQVRKLPYGQLWRHNQAGDLPGEGEEIDREAMQALNIAVLGQRMFTYTHKHNGEQNRQTIADFNRYSDGTINLSANSAAHADELASLGIGPVCTVLPSDQTTNCQTPAGRKIVVCPATVRDDVTCASCQLCARKNRSVIIGFPAHGTSKRKASATAAAGTQ